MELIEKAQVLLATNTATGFTSKTFISDVLFTGCDAPPSGSTVIVSIDTAGLAMPPSGAGGSLASAGVGSHGADESLTGTGGAPSVFSGSATSIVLNVLSCYAHEQRRIRSVSSVLSRVCL